MPSQVKLDEIDVNIIRVLQRDARTNFADIAKDSGVSIDTISKRFKKMKRAGIIRGTTVLLNPKSFGYDCVASFGIRVDYPKDTRSGLLQFFHGQTQHIRHSDSKKCW